MASHAIKKLIGVGRSSMFQRPLMSRYYSLWNPDYLEDDKTKMPTYVKLNIEMKGYDYPVLESYQKLVDNIVRNLDIEIADRWAFPPKIEKITRLKPRTTVIDAEYTLHTYERNIQIEDVSGSQYSLLLRILEACIPEGVTMTVDYWNPLKEEKRYVPDKELLDLKEQLENITPKKSVR